MEAHFKRFNVANVNYSLAGYDPYAYAVKSDGVTMLAFKTELDDVDVHYVFDFDFPTSSRQNIQALQ